jgi:GNAT superfamily N-acetyltransferase
MNIALMDATAGARFWKRKKLLGDRDAYSECCPRLLLVMSVLRPLVVLKKLYVRPELQRNGIGARCLKLGVEKADELGLPAYTWGSSEGMSLYLRHGFREVDRMTVDLGDWGGEKGDLHSYGLLYREASTLL